jgi:hypothetical protein
MKKERMKKVITKGKEEDDPAGWVVNGRRR